MSWDIAIIAGVAIAQLILTWYGVHVSVEKKRVRNAIVIGVVGGLGIALTIWGGIRNDKAQQSLQNQLDTIQRNTEKPQPTPVVNVLPPLATEHTHGDWIGPQPVKNNPLLPLYEGERPYVNFGFRNVGDVAMSSLRLGVMIALIPKNDAHKSFVKFYKQIPRRGESGTLVPHTDDFTYSTFVGTALRKEDIAALNNGDSWLCAIGSVKWKDATGNFETYLFRCMWVQSDHSFNWQLLPEDNTEHVQSPK